ncbi:hypothetical protein CLV51_103346 [Chitinophaga niastensis]|uniref:Uncharacterized protein n=1 Tax=Chitinophaga niastensis TaxID=536980 RepID=A0A2P8HJG1_CHINA|nr:hypothetical protein CLV51_103346 [Chitinophaga niastensis]
MLYARNCFMIIFIVTLKNILTLNQYFHLFIINPGNYEEKCYPINMCVIINHPFV